MRAIQEDGGGRLTLISEDVEDCFEIGTLCDIADAIKYGGYISIICEETGCNRGISVGPSDLITIHERDVIVQERIKFKNAFVG